MPARCPIATHLVLLFISRTITENTKFGFGNGHIEAVQQHQSVLMLPSLLGPAVRSSRVAFHSHPLGKWPAPTATLRCRSSRQHHGFRPGAHVVPRDFPHTQIRGKRTRTVVSLDDLPQGLVRADSLPAASPPGEHAEAPAAAAPSYPTVVLQARRNMQRFDNCVLLTRVGGFYELYFEHADEYGPLLNLKVAQKKTAAGPVPMVILSPAMSLSPSPSPLPPFGPDVVCFCSALAPSPRFLMVVSWVLGRLSILPARSIPQDLGPGLEPVCGRR